MSEYFFGTGRGWLGKNAAKIAAKHGAELTNYIEPQCNCGWGCATGDCKKSRRHWFSCENLGSGHDDRIRDAVISELREKGIIAA